MKRLAASAVALAALGAPAAAAAAPRLGDWEGTGRSGAVGSFAVTTVSARSHGQVVRHRTVEDLVVQAPINCVNAFGTPLPIDVEVIKAAIPLGSHDSFSHGRIKRSGSSTKITASYRSGRFHVTYRHLVKSRNLYEGGTETCDTGKLRLTFKPGHRRALKTGLWVGQTAEQEPVELSVVAGGRALQTPLGPGPGGTAEYAFQIAGNSSTDPCAYEIASPLFIEPNGTFSNSNVRLGDDAVVTGTFTGRSSGGSGQFSYQAQSCLQEGWSASWSFR